MLEEIQDLQNSSVLSIIDKLQNKDEVVFKAPTGSGKTYMMAEMMNTIISSNPNVVFIVSSLSKGDLAYQNYEKFIEYSDHEFQNLNTYLISSDSSSEEGIFIPEQYNVYVLPRDLYKDKSKIKDSGALHNFLFIMSKKSFGKKEMYLIKDECHITTNNLDDLIKPFFHKVINFSATPKLSRGQVPDVEITEQQAEKCNLIKKVIYGDEVDNVDKAFNKLLEVKQKYIDDDFNMQPCLIIQISNQDKALEEISELKSTMNINYPDLHWCIIVDSDKDCETNDKTLIKLPISKWKDELKKSTSNVDVIIFKMVITEGWDIPRACILYQVRDTQSKQLDEQVIGRVRRNPKLLTFETLTQEAKELATTAYVWGTNLKNKSNYREVRLFGDEEDNYIQKELKVITTRLKEILEVNTFDISDFIKEQPNIDNNYGESIFEIYNKCKRLKGETKKLYDNYVKDTITWLSFTNNLEAIDKKVKDIEADYDVNMEVVKDENGNPIEYKIPYKSYYQKSSINENISYWIWKNNDNTIMFDFDSEAEKQWYEILARLRDVCVNNDKEVIKKCNISNQRIFLLGKNYLNNSNIKFDYYLYGIHSSYPDFIMKDSFNRIHLFESKSINNGYNNGIDSAEYIEKVDALKKCYLYASKLVPYYFYIPVLRNNTWSIYQFYNGKSYILNIETFQQFLQTNNAINNTDLI